MARVLVTEALSEAAVDLLRRSGHEVSERLGMGPAELLEAVADAEALIVRSATQVTAEVLAAAPLLAVVGRAGVGIDNVDIQAATAHGVVVANTPTANVISAAEHTLALMLACARNVAQAHAALLAGRWEREQNQGVELHGKTLGIVGLGRIGRLVAERAQAFGMELVGYDPFVPVEAAREFGVEHIEVDEIAARADFITLHVAKTPETVGLIGRGFLAKAKPELRVVNVSRGGVVDEEALAEAIISGRIAGAGLDVFDTEPCTSSPLFGLPGVVVTPHLGASTRDAQLRVGTEVAEQVSLVLVGKPAPNALNPEACSR